MTDHQAKRLWMEYNCLERPGDVLVVASLYQGKFCLFAPHGCGQDRAAGLGDFASQQDVFDHMHWRYIKIGRHKNIRLICQTPIYLRFLVTV